MGEWADWLAEREDQEIADSYTNFDRILDKILKEEYTNGNKKRKDERDKCGKTKVKFIWL